MRYTSFHIENYKGIITLDLHLEKHTKSNVFILVGLNECGKTTVLEAINLIKYMVDEDEINDMVPKKLKHNFNDSISITAKLALSQRDTQILKTALQSSGYREIEIPGECSYTKSFNFINSLCQNLSESLDLEIYAKKKGKRTRALVTIEEIRDAKLDTRLTKLIPPIIFYQNFLFTFPEKIYLDEPENQTDRIYKDVVQDILSIVDPKATIQDHIIGRMAASASGSSDSLANLLRKMESVLDRKVLRAWHDVFRSDDSTGVLRSVSIRHGQMTTKTKVRPYLELTFNQGDEVFRVKELSLGLRWFLAFVLFTELRKTRIAGAVEPLFLLDEPASNLHSSAQSRLLKKIGDLTKDCALIYTTHSHHLINPEWLDSTFVIRNAGFNEDTEWSYNAAATNIQALPYRRFVAENPSQYNYYQPVLDALEYMPSRLELVPDIILLEGKYDYILLRYMQLNTVKDKIAKSLRLCAGLGASKAVEPLRLYSAWGRKCLLVLDSDSGGEAAKQYYADIFGDWVLESVVDLAGVLGDSKYKRLEDLIDKADKELLVSEAGLSKGTTKKNLFNAVSTLLMTKTRVQLSADTAQRFEELLKRLSSKLQGLTMDWQCSTTDAETRDLEQPS